MIKERKMFCASNELFGNHRKVIFYSNGVRMELEGEANLLEHYQFGEDYSLNLESFLVTIPS